MVTVVTKTIGTASRDYSTLQAWEDAAPANLVTADQVWRGECYADAEFSAALTVSGSTVDATRYKELTVAAGQSFADHANKLTNALRYNASNGAALRSTTAWGTALTASESYFRISRLQVYQDSSNGHALWVSGQGAVVDGVISESRGGRALYLYANGTAKNSLFVSRRASSSEVADIWDGCSVANCTFAVPSDIAAATRVVRRSYWSGNTFTNCGFFGGTDAVSSATGATFSNCYTDDSTSIPSGCTTVAYDTSTGSGFENISNGTHDYRIKSTSALKDAGTSTGAPSVDIVGTTRPSGSGYDVGAWEYASGGGNTVAVPSGSLTLSGLTPTVVSTANQTVSVPAGSVALSGFAPTVTATDHQTIAVPAGSLSLTGFAPSVSVSAANSIQVPVGTLSLTAFAPTIAVSGNQTVSVPAGVLTATGLAPTVISSDHKTVAVPSGALTVTANAPTVNVSADQVIQIPAGSLSLSGYAPSVVQSDNQLIVVPLGTISMSGRVPSVSNGAGGGTADPSAIVAALMAYEVEAGVTVQTALRVMLAAVSGPTSGLGTDTERYFDPSGVIARITATFDGNSNRTSVTLDGS